MSRSRGARSFTRSPPMIRSPEVMSSSPAIIRSAVDFPQPDGPTRIMNSPSPMSRSIAFTASKPSGYRLVTLSNAICATASLPLLKPVTLRHARTGSGRCQVGRRVSVQNVFEMSEGTRDAFEGALDGAPDGRRLPGAPGAPLRRSLRAARAPLRRAPGVRARSSRRSSGSSPRRTRRAGRRCAGSTTSARSRPTGSSASGTPATSATSTASPARSPACASACRTCRSSASPTCT